MSVIYISYLGKTNGNTNKPVVIVVVFQYGIRKVSFSINTLSFALLQFEFSLFAVVVPYTDGLLEQQRQHRRSMVYHGRLYH